MAVRCLWIDTLPRLLTCLHLVSFDLSYTCSLQQRAALSQYYACDADYVVKIPDSISWEVAGCIQPLAVAVQVSVPACRCHPWFMSFSAFQTCRSRCRTDARRFVSLLVARTEDLLIRSSRSGCGPLGCMVMALARAHGVSKIVAFDLIPKRVAFAKAQWADYAAVPPKREDGAEYHDWANAYKERALTEAGVDTFGVDVAVDAAGAEEVIHAGIAFVRPGGTCRNRLCRGSEHG